MIEGMPTSRTPRAPQDAQRLSGKSGFDQLVQKETQAVTDPAGKPVDWAAQREEWLKYLDQLYSFSEEALKEYVQAHQVSIDYENVVLVEEYIGRYTARQMIVRIGRKQVRFEPIGTLLVGTKGRVDAIGPFGKVPILLLDSEARSLQDMIKVSVNIGGAAPVPPIPRARREIKWAWRIVSRAPDRKITELNKDNFLSLLTEVANG
jgi:hypothetical protein